MQSWREKNAEARFQLQSALDYKRFQDNWGDITSKARTVAIVTPLNDVLDLCETITGRETCLESGRVLSKNERLFAAAGVILGSRVLWEQVSRKLKINLFDDIIPASVIDADSLVVHHADVVNLELKAKGYVSPPPYSSEDLVSMFKTKHELKDVFVRVYGGNSRISSRFIVPKKLIEGMSPVEISKYLNLGYIPEFVAAVTIPQGTYLRAGLVNPINSSVGKAIQYEIIIENLAEGVILDDLFKPLGRLK